MKILDRGVIPGRLCLEILKQLNKSTERENGK